ncbi:uncharacterized protein M421DRAFT_181353 [Didymella exigua CBS 183.55]|uniref:Uncharacterized protein n=1 Tax=Didymella exigua CBS 183.55 TaxID=1150837 RepID=A0A6A5RHV8_9PLEO|nr:uncharacterized protein M421DRAFT_181353 [Didymella exigua CBS 183.55]KAF1927073.1 hypothetical protein M421DRAFT_181353 [Didymella exigua CBS 183.55]
MRLMEMNTTVAAVAGYATILAEPLAEPLVAPFVPMEAPGRVGAAFTTSAPGSSNLMADSRYGGWGWPGNSPSAVSSASRCSTTYGASAPPWGASTDYFTSTSYAYRVKTEVLTPKPSTTSVSATSTYTQWETAPNNLTKTVWTDTYTWTNYLTTTATVSETSTITTSVLSTTTVPTPDGFTPVAAVYPEAAKHVDDWGDRDNWAVEDSYWQDEGNDPWILPLAANTAREGALLDAAVPLIAESTPVRTDQASKVDCLVTMINIYDSGTTTSKSFVSPPTYTRTKYVATETTTTTVTTKINPTETPYTYTMASGLEIKSWFTETTTKTETTTTTEYPSSTTTEYAACATDNVIDTYEGFPLNNLAKDWYSKNSTVTVIRSSWWEFQNVTACCNNASQYSNAIFYKYDGTCEVFLDDHTNTRYNASGKIDVEVWYEPRERGWWGPSVGNGPRGSISFSSLWL